MKETKEALNRSAPPCPPLDVKQRKGRGRKIPEQASRSAKMQGRRKGEGGVLTVDQQRQICETLRTTSPQNHGLTARLWDHDGVRQLAAAVADADISDRTLRNCLLRWGLGGIGPARDRRASCSVAMQQWLDQHWSEVEAEARKNGGEIFWLYVRNMPDTELWFPAGYADSRSLKLVAAVTTGGAVRWQIVSGSFNAQRQIAFLKRLCEDVRHRRRRNIEHRPSVYAIRVNERTYFSRKLQSELLAEGIPARLFPPPSGD